MMVGPSVTGNLVGLVNRRVQASSPLLRFATGGAGADPSLPPAACRPWAPHLLEAQLDCVVSLGLPLLLGVGVFRHWACAKRCRSVGEGVKLLAPLPAGPMRRLCALL